MRSISMHAYVISTAMMVLLSAPGPFAHSAPDEGEISGTPCAGDVNGSGAVDIDDLLAVIGAWGACPSPPALCPTDIVPSGGNGLVNIDDLLAVIGGWGPCPCDPDPYEPNQNCGESQTLSSVGSDQTITYASMNLSAVGNEDFFVFPCHESDSSCGCGASNDEDYIINVTLTVPASASTSYVFCMNVNSCSFPTGYCETVAPGASVTLTRQVDGSCPGADNYNVYVRIAQSVPVATECTPYTLSCFFDAGYCF